MLIGDDGKRMMDDTRIWQLFTQSQVAPAETGAIAVACGYSHSLYLTKTGEALNMGEYNWCKWCKKKINETIALVHIVSWKQWKRCAAVFGSFGLN